MSSFSEAPEGDTKKGEKVRNCISRPARWSSCAHGRCRTQCIACRTPRQYGAISHWQHSNQAATVALLRQGWSLMVLVHMTADLQNQVLTVPCGREGESGGCCCSAAADSFMSLARQSRSLSKHTQQHDADIISSLLQGGGHKQVCFATWCCHAKPSMLAGCCWPVYMLICQCLPCSELPAR